MAGTERDRHTMDTEAHNRMVVGRWLAAFWGDPCDLAAVDELAAPDMLLQYAPDGPRRGRRAVRGFMAGFREAFPDLAFRRIGPLMADRDFVVFRWEATGTHTGPFFHDFRIGPLPSASGRRLLLSGHSALRLEDGLIAEEAVWSTERKAARRPVTGGLLMTLA